MRGPWYITVRAVQDYLRLQGHPAVTDGPDFDRAEDELIAIALKLAAKGPTSTPQHSGAGATQCNPRRAPKAISPNSCACRADLWCGRLRPAGASGVVAGAAT